MSSKNFGSAGIIEVPLTAVAQNGIVSEVIGHSVSDETPARPLVQVQDSSGNIMVPAAGAFSINFDKATRTVKYTNLAAAAFTGTLVIITVA